MVSTQSPVSSFLDSSCTGSSLIAGVSATLGGLSKRFEAAAGAGAANGDATAGAGVVATAAAGVTGSAAVVPEYGGGGIKGDVGPAEGASAAFVAPGVK